MRVAKGEQEHERGPVDGLKHVGSVGPVDHRSILVTQRLRSLSSGMAGGELFAMLRSARQLVRLAVVAQPHVIAQSIRNGRA